MNKFLSVTDTFGPKLNQAISEGRKKIEHVQEQNATLVQANVIKGIRSQKYKSNWPELAEETKKRKAKLGQSNLTLIAEGDLSSSFEIVKENDSTFVVGTNKKQARAQEFGFEASGIPERSYFRPALEDSKKQILENFKTVLGEIFK